MDMDRDSLELMLNLLDTDCNIKTALEGHRELAKNKQKVLILSQMSLLIVCIDINLLNTQVIDICTEMKAAGHAGSLNIDLLSADHLAMETLLRLDISCSYRSKIKPCSITGSQSVINSCLV